jgi:hypothetical protein
MKRLLITFSALLFISHSHFAQQNTPEDNQIYRANDDKLYVNKELGIYLWISTSPDPNSEKIPLMSDSSKRYSNPMYLDTEGYNSIRHKSAVNPSTHEIVYPLQDVIFEVYADGLNPTSSADFSSGSVKKLNGKKYFGGDLKIELNSADATSGVQSLKFKINNNDFSEYKEPLINFKEGENTLEYFATDKVGNKEELKKDVFYIDNTPPKTEHQIEGNRSDKYVSADAVIKLTASDNISGVKSIFYKINSGAYIRYTIPIPVKVFTNDETSLSYYSEDNLGNKEAVKTIGGKAKSILIEGSSSEQNSLFEFYIDREPPQVTIEVDVDQYKGKSTFVSPRSHLKVIAEDEKSGVDKVFFSINNPLVENLYKEPFTLNEEGLQSIRVKSKDYVGNSSPLLTKNYVVDVKAPVSKLLIGSPKFLSHDTLYITERTPVTLSAVDDQSGVSSIQYTVENTEFVYYSKPFNISTSGSKTIAYLASDNVNNKEVVKTQNLYVDNLPPAIIYHFSVESIGKKNVRDEVYTIYPTNAMLYIAATDARSGGEKIEYSINGGALLAENPIKSFLPGNYIVQVNAFDVLGNKSTQEVKFAIEK